MSEIKIKSANQLSSEILSNSSSITLKKAQEIAEVEMVLAKGRAAALFVLMEAEEKYAETMVMAIESMNGAENTLSDEIIQMRLKLVLMDKLPDLLTASGKSVEDIMPFLREIINTMIT